MGKALWLGTCIFPATQGSSGKIRRLGKAAAASCALSPAAAANGTFLHALRHHNSWNGLLCLGACHCFGPSSVFVARTVLALPHEDCSILVY